MKKKNVCLNLDAYENSKKTYEHKQHPMKVPLFQKIYVTTNLSDSKFLQLFVMTTIPLKYHFYTFFSHPVI